MRKLLMLVTMLLVPALANAWTLPVKVTNTTAGITAGNKATVTVGATSTDVTVGTKYFYPASSVASVSVAVAHSENLASITLDGVAQAQNATGVTTVVVPQKTLSSLNIVYNSAASAPKADVAIVQVPGGLTSISIGASSTTVGYTGVAVGTAVTVKAQPNTGYTLTNIKVNNAIVATASPFTFVVADTAADSVTATYAQTPVISATLSLASSGNIGTPVNATVNASGTTGLTYAWTVNGVAAGTAATQAVTPIAGSNIVYVTVSGDGAVPVTKSATIQGVDAVASANFTCTTCHAGSTPAVVAAYNAGTHGSNGPVAATATCNSCHTTTPHDSKTCIGCHSVARPNVGAAFVNDNNGVRSITQEFTKWSHHVTGVELQDAHCAACHLEGKVENGAIVVDATYHIADNKTHLRNADTDADMQWNPAAPSHSTMDNFCMSCHDANGATSTQSAAIQAVIVPAAGKTASAKNPFGDTISNRYDKMQRPGVVNVDDQFDTTNNSHHGVKGPRYTGRTRNVAGPRTIAAPAAFAANSSATLWGKRSTIYDSVNATTGVSELATNPAFTSLYTPLENAGGEVAPRKGAATLGDDSTLHCGDCHTVGQWKAGSAKIADGTATTAVIGAHGSNNEYMLRNDKGTDERHTQEAYIVSGGTVVYSAPNSARLICYNCHAFKRYGSVYSATGTAGPHAGEYDANGRCNGVGNTIPFNGYTTGTATDGTQFESRIGEFTRAQGSSTPAFAPGFPLNFANSPSGVQAATYTGEQDADFGNVFGIQCLNCHNSGIGNGYGGIHGSANNSPGTANIVAKGGYAVPDPSVLGGAYVDGMGNTTKVQRFLPGLGNVMHVPGTLGGFNTAGVSATSWRGDVAPAGTQYTFTTGAIAKDTNWEQVGWRQAAGTPTNGPQVGAGCYTLNDEGTGSGLDDPNSSSYGLKGQPWDGTTTQTPDAAKTWGGCDDHTGTSVGSSDHGFVKRINRPVTY